MLAEQLTEDLQAIRTKALQYFPDCIFANGAHPLETTDGSEILTEPDQFLSHLRTAFFEEHIVEIQLDHSTRSFFTSIEDHLPEIVDEESDSELGIIEPDYETGAYLLDQNHILLTPLTPGIGNARIRNTDKITLRYFTGTNAVELGCTFAGQTMIREVPLLKLDFPIIGRINKSYRPFRVKAISTVDAKAHLISPPSASYQTFGFQVVDVSAFGMGFEVPAEQVPFQTGDDLTLTIKVSDLSDLVISGNVRHISKVRDKKGFRNICGLQFDLETRALAAEIEQVVAAIQRMQLREIAEKKADVGGYK